MSISRPKWGSKKRRPVPDLRHEREAILAKVRAGSIVDPVTGCWNWQKHRNEVGYGTTSWKGRPWMLTRLVLAATAGAFDPDLDACHSCHNRGCGNPDHLRPDEHQANLMDGSRAGRLQGQWKTHCKRGHPLTPDNLDKPNPKRPWRHCRICDTERRRTPEYLAKQRVRSKLLNERRRERRRLAKLARLSG